MSQVTHKAGAYLWFLFSMNRLGIILFPRPLSPALDQTLVHQPQLYGLWLLHTDGQSKTPSPSYPVLSSLI